MTCRLHISRYTNDILKGKINAERGNVTIDRKEQRNLYWSITREIRSAPALIIQLISSLSRDRAFSTIQRRVLGECGGSAKKKKKKISTHHRYMEVWWVTVETFHLHRDNCGSREVISNRKLRAVLLLNARRSTLSGCTAGMRR